MNEVMNPTAPTPRAQTPDMSQNRGNWSHFLSGLHGYEQEMDEHRELRQA
jgi:hypothetical protein